MVLIPSWQNRHKAEFQLSLEVDFFSHQIHIPLFILSFFTMASKYIVSAFVPAILLAFLTVLLYFVTYEVFCAALVAIVAWNSVVKTLELNDFRHKIKSSPLRGSRYIAALVATRLGLRDALLDWTIIYSLGYAIVAGFTWNDADPNSLLVLWGFSVIIASLILAVLGLKVPQWVSLYNASTLSICNIHLSFVYALYDC